MSIIIVVALILAAILFLIIELFLIPGISIAGIASFIFFALGITFAYKFFGNQWGNVTLLITFVIVIGVLIKAFKPGTWKKFSLESRIDSKSRIAEELASINIGDKGIAKSKLSPIGEIEVNGIICEAESTGMYIEPGQQVEIQKIEGIKIYVKPLN